MASSRPSLFPSMPNAHTRHGDSFGGSAFGGGRLYDYKMKYPADKPGEEHTENARVWNVYLDEVESHDRDLLQGFRDIIDGVLVFASLFSAVVTTLVAQTSQVLQPDNTQIMASILFENNQLLRAAGNVTSINAVPKSTLSPGDVIHTSLDVWVNGLFFASLGLSLSTALLTVLVKQWLHAYSLFITGDARRRAFITHLRSQGLKTWRLREIVEALPLILHGSVLLFFVGLVLYVSQLSTPICAVLAIIAALAFIFYFGTSILPFVFIACPYRIVFFFNVCQSIRYGLLYLRKYILSGILLARAVIPARLHDICQQKRYQWSKPSRQSLELAEAQAIENKPRITLDILQQLLQTSDQRSTQQIVLEAVFAILKECELPPERRRPPFSHLLEGQPLLHTLMEETFRLSLVEYTSTVDGDGPQVEIIANTWEKRIASLNKGIEIDGRKKIPCLFAAFSAADRQDNRHPCKCILDWIGQPALEDASNTTILLSLMTDTTGNGIRQILKRTGTGTLSKLLWTGTTLLHYYAWRGALDQVKAVVEADGSDEVVNYVSSLGETPLDAALLFLQCEIVSYLMDHGGRARKTSYEDEFFYAIGNSHWDMVKLLWRRRREVRIVDTRPASWCTKSATEVANDTWTFPRDFDESKRRELIEILQQCDEENVDEGHPLTSSHLEPVEESTELDPEASHADEVIHASFESS
ncbi:hypothetical protein H0H93_005470, partial [Arthromyces matolae]